MNSMNIDRANVEDIDTLYHWGENNSELWFGGNIRWYDKKLISKLIDSDRSVFLVARVDGEPAGMCLVQNMFVWGYCDTLFVEEKFRKEGIARKLLETAEELLRDTGINLFVLHIETENTTANKFYKKMGFADGYKYQWMLKRL